MKRQVSSGLPLTILILISFVCSYLPAEASEQVKEDLLRKIIERASENEQEIEKYGYDVNLKVRWLKRNGITKKTEIRDYRTAWVEEVPRLELYLINARPLNLNQRKAELQSKKELQKALQNGNSKSKCHRIPFTWTELMRKYDFTIDPNDHSAAYVLAFQHKNIELPSRSRIEKVLNHLDGKIWVDQEFRITKLQGALKDDVSFGFGLAKVTNMDFEFVQKPYNDLTIPVSFRLKFNVKALFIYSDQREITSIFSNYHLNPAFDQTLQVSLGTPTSK